MNRMNEQSNHWESCRLTRKRDREKKGRQMLQTKHSSKKKMMLKNKTHQIQIFNVIASIRAFAPIYLQSQTSEWANERTKQPTLWHTIHLGSGFSFFILGPCFHKNRQQILCQHKQTFTMRERARNTGENLSVSNCKISMRKHSPWTTADPPPTFLFVAFIHFLCAFDCFDG